jgi:hypothetical protein
MSVAASCVHHWTVETGFDSHSLGWRGTCRKCGMERVFPLKDYYDPRDFAHGTVNWDPSRRGRQWNG